ncbi:MAG: hypothetical protein DRJ34_03575 [Thermoprotei archaeon]|nr:MAG: hypothetical protein DRJ34_03575 [Thermoprotei archaeon]RLE69771.1 MAG: hypothetical protein DRJ45_06230 [Thermoprotei archaeon]
MDNSIFELFSMLFFIIGSIIYVIILIYAIQIAIAIWVYRDAKKRGEDALLWLLIVLLTGLIGLIIYVLIRGDKSYNYG